MKDYWQEDQLGYAEVGNAFTRLIQTIDKQTVISIEAGFGRGKTFFANAWAEHLRQEGEVVVELDVKLSDHSGDPVVTLLGAMLEAVPESQKSRTKTLLDSAKTVGAVGSKALARMVLKAGADEVIEAVTESTSDNIENYEALQGVVEGVGNEMSKAVGQMIATQMATEKVRKVELPAQLEALKSALLNDATKDRIVVIVDELDRCHPDYAIEFLEALKLIFSQAGFVFCLMVNADYLENLARHRFGNQADDERYLDKFVDIRLQLRAKNELYSQAIYELAKELPLAIPYGADAEFSIEKAAEVASTMALDLGLSLRKAKRALLKVEIALRCYSDHPLDAPLLVFLAFGDINDSEISTKFLPRARLTPQNAEGVAAVSTGQRMDPIKQHEEDRRRGAYVAQNMQELVNLPSDRYRFPKDENKDYKTWAKVLIYLAAHYIPFHRDVLDAVAGYIDEE